MAKALRITLAARAVVAKGYEFSLRPGSFADAGVALDEILSLPPPAEPLVLRVTATGGRKAGRARVEGDWLCDATPGEPRRIPAPAWTHSREAAAWVKKRPWLEAWETCENALWMLHAAVRVVVDRRLVVRAACACARTVLDRIPAVEERPRRAIEAAEAWTRGEATVVQVQQAAYSAAYSASAPASDTYSYSAAAASASAAADAVYISYASDAATYTAAAAAYYAAYGYASDAASQSRALARLADLVRGEIPTWTVLRAAIERAA